MRKPRIFKRKDSNVWQIEYCDGSGHRHRESAETTCQDEAERRLREACHNVDQGNPIPDPRLKRATVADLLYNYLEWMQIRKLQSIETVRKYILPELIHFCGALEARALTTQHLQRFVLEKQAEGLSNSAIRGFLSAISGALTRATEQTPPLLAHKITIPWPPKDAARRGSYTSEEWEKLRIAIAMQTPKSIHAWPVLELLRLTGVRLSDLLGRREDHENKTKGKMGLEWENVYLHDKLPHLVLGKTKNGDPRLVPLVPEAVQILETLYLERLATGSRLPWVFTRNGGPLASIRTAFETARREAGLPKKLIHDCRRTFRRKLYESGIEDKLGMALMGHRDHATYQSYFTVSTDDLASAIRRMATKQADE